MEHGPFILASYTIAAVLLAWCALSPLMRGRKLKRSILNRAKQVENEHAPNP